MIREREPAAGATPPAARPRHRNAPVAVYEDEAPRTGWLEILNLAERLGSGPSLVPADIVLRTVPESLCPMPAGLRKSYDMGGAAIGGFDEMLIEQRDRILREHLVLPLTFQRPVTGRLPGSGSQRYQRRRRPRSMAARTCAGAVAPK